MGDAGPTDVRGVSSTRDQGHRGWLLPVLVASLLVAGVAVEQVVPLARPGLLTSAGTVVVAPLVLLWARRLSDTPVRWTVALADAGAVTLVAALPRWWPADAFGPAGDPRPERALDLVAVLAVLLVLFVMTSTSARTRVSPGVRVLVVGGLVPLAGHAAWMLAPHGSGPPAWWPALLPLLAAASWAALALLRPLVAPARGVEAGAAPGAADEGRAGGGRLALLALLGGAAPASLLIGDAPVTAVDVGPVVVSCALLALCSLAHLSWRARRLAELARERWEAAEQQRSLVAAGEGLLQAQDREQVARAAASGAVRLLTATGAPTAAAGVALGSPELMELVAVDGTGLALADAAGLDLALLTDTDRAALRRGEVVLRAADGPGGPDGPGGSGTAAHVLVVLPLRSRRRELGALVVAGPRAALGQARPTLGALAVHVALALDAVAPPSPGAPRPHGPSEGARPSGLVRALTQGLRAGEFACHYQPVVDMVGGGVVGFEALVRWSHPQRGLLLPAAFLPAVEDAGLLTALDDHLLVRACEDAVRIDPTPSGPYVSVNLSRGQLADPGLADRVEGALAAAGLAPWRLQLEVTEASSLERPQQTAATLRRLRALRVRVAFDDFGTGESSLSWLHQLPLDVVKVDKSFVDQLPAPAGTPPVVAAVTALSHVLGLGVVAEGVETVEQQRELVAMGVHHAQGWLYAKALPLDQAREYARSRRAAAAPATAQASGSLVG